MKFNAVYVKSNDIEKLDCVYIFVDNEVWLCERGVVLKIFID